MSSHHRELLANVRPLRPIRLLLAGREARYLRAMAFLFDRRGYATRLTLKPEGLFAEADAFRPEVAILVEGDSFGDAVGQAMGLISRSDRLAVIVATSRADAPNADRLRFVDKEASFEPLAEAVERAWTDLPPA